MINKHTLLPAESGGVFKQYYGMKVDTSAIIMGKLSPLEIFGTDIITSDLLLGEKIDVELLKERYESMILFWTEKKELMGDPVFEDNVLTVIEEAFEKIIVGGVTYNSINKIYRRLNMPERVINILSIDPYIKPILQVITHILLQQKSILPETHKTISEISETPIWSTSNIDTSTLMPQIEKELITNINTIFEIIREDDSLWEFYNSRFFMNPHNFKPTDEEDTLSLLIYAIDILIKAIGSNHITLYFHFIKNNYIISKNPEYFGLKYIKTPSSEPAKKT